MKTEQVSQKSRSDFSRIWIAVFLSFLFWKGIQMLCMKDELGRESLLYSFLFPGLYIIALIGLRRVLSRMAFVHLTLVLLLSTAIASVLAYLLSCVIYSLFTTGTLRRLSAGSGNWPTFETLALSFRYVLLAQWDFILGFITAAAIFMTRGRQ